MFTEYRKGIPVLTLAVTCLLVLAACSNTRPVPGTLAQPDMTTPAGRMTAQLVKALQTCWLDRKEFTGVILIGPKKDLRGTYHVALREAEGTPRPNRNIDFSVSDTNGQVGISVGPMHAHNYGDEFNKLTHDILFQRAPCSGVAAAKIFEPKAVSTGN